MNTIHTLVAQLLSTYQNSDWKIAIIKQWPDIIGDLAAHVVIEKIDDTVITLGVFDSCWLQELHLLSPLLLQKINRTLDDKKIKQVRLKQVPRTRNKQLLKKHQKESTQRNNKAVALHQQEIQALARVPDKALANALKRFFEKICQEKE
ncbi:MAG: DciA family protein [Candidatus Babeliales bacterium]